MGLWTTDNVRQKDRFDVWEAVVSRAINTATADREGRGDFEAQLVARSYGSMRVAWFHSEQHRIARTHKHIRAEDDHPYLVSLQVSGRSSIAQCDARFHLDVDEIAIVDTRFPYEIDFSPHVERMIAVLSRATLESRIPSLRRRHTLKIEADFRYSDLSRRHIRELVSREDKPEGETSLLAENVCNLLALATRDVQIDQFEDAMQIETILSFCRNNIADPELSAGLVSAHFDISLRTLHARFERLGLTFAGWVLERRLEACRQALLDSRQSKYTISEIAYRNGFNDLSHFCRMFKRRYHLTAREWRSQARPN
ncbi:helix-turn-helix domain-containing protein [Bradyrhizobium sp. 14AA]